MKSSDITHLATLSHLGLPESKLEEFRGDFQGILAHIEDLQSISEEVDTLPRYHTQYLRQDQVMQPNPAFSSDVRDKIRDQFPASDQGYLVVKSILKKYGLSFNVVSCSIFSAFPLTVVSSRISSTRALFILVFVGSPFS